MLYPTPNSNQPGYPEGQGQRYPDPNTPNPSPTLPLSLTYSGGLPRGPGPPGRARVEQRASPRHLWHDDGADARGLCAALPAPRRGVPGARRQPRLADDQPEGPPYPRATAVTAQYLTVAALAASAVHQERERCRPARARPPHRQAPRKARDFRSPVARGLCSLDVVCSHTLFSLYNIVSQLTHTHKRVFYKLKPCGPVGGCAAVRHTGVARYIDIAGLGS